MLKTSHHTRKKNNKKQTNANKIILQCLYFVLPLQNNDIFVSLFMCFCSTVDELWPFKCHEVMVDSIQSETNFTVSQLSKDGSSILMCIIWPRMCSRNLVRSTGFSLFKQEKPHSQTYWKLVCEKICCKLIIFLINSSIFFIRIQKDIIKPKEFIKIENLLCMIRITKINSMN